MHTFPTTSTPRPQPGSTQPATHLLGAGIQHWEIKLLVAGAQRGEQVEELAGHLAAALLSGAWPVHLRVGELGGLEWWRWWLVG
jgi:hypothetical protein